MRQEATLIHGTASTSAQTWIRNGWLDLLEDMDIPAALFPLPGHVGSTFPATAPLDSVVEGILDAAPRSNILIGFSAGAMLALHAALQAEGRITKLVLLGIGDGFWRTTSSAPDMAERLRRGETDAFTRMMTGMAAAAGNTLEDVMTFIEASHPPPPLAMLRMLSARTLIVCGDDDATGPATRLAAAVPDATVVSPAGLDHFRTPSSPQAMGAATRFLS